MRKALALTAAIAAGAGSGCDNTQRYTIDVPDNDEKTTVMAECSWGKMPINYIGDTREQIAKNNNFVLNEREGTVTGHQNRRSSRIDFCGYTKYNLGGVDLRATEKGDFLGQAYECRRRVINGTVANERPNCLPEDFLIKEDGTLVHKFDPDTGWIVK